MASQSPPWTPNMDAESAEFFRKLANEKYGGNVDDLGIMRWSSEWRMHRGNGMNPLDATVAVFRSIDAIRANAPQPQNPPGPYDVPWTPQMDGEAAAFVTNLRALYRDHQSRDVDETGWVRWSSDYRVARANNFSAASAWQKIEREILRIWGVSTPSVPSTYRTPRGILRLEGRTYRDDAGLFLGGTASFFHAIRTYRQNRAKFDDDARACADTQADSARIITDLGWPKTGLGIDRSQNGPEHLDDLGASMDALFELGVRTHITLLGSLMGATYVNNRWEKQWPYHLEKQSQRLAYAAQVCGVINAGRNEKIWGVEVCNEPENGSVGPLSRDDQAELQAFIKRRLPHNLVTLGAPGGRLGETSWDGVDYAWYAEHGDMALPHLDRGFRDNGYGHIHQGIHSAQDRYPWKNNEPIGPGSSVAAESNPGRLRMAATCTWVCRGADYCWHAYSGIGLGADSDYPLRNEPGFGVVFSARKVLPEDLPNFQFHNWHWTSNPLESLDGVPTDPGQNAKRGAVRTLACTSGSRRVFQVIGVAEQGVRWRPRETMRLKVYKDGAYDAPQDEVTVTQGGEYSLPQADEYILVGERA